MGAFLVTDNRITMGHSVACSVQLLTLLTCSTGLGSLGSLCSLTWFTGLLTVSWDGWNQLTNTVFTLKMQKLGKVVRLSLTVKQGRIHGYPSCVRVGRGCIWGHLITWAGAVRPKTTKTPKKLSVTDGQTDRPTDGPSDGPTKRGVELPSTRQEIRSMGLFLIMTIAFWKGHTVARYVYSLTPLTPFIRSTALQFTTLTLLACSVHGLAHSGSGLLVTPSKDNWN